MRSLPLSLVLLAAAVPARADAPAGSVRGTVVFDGKAPARARLAMASDPFCAKRASDAEDVVVADGKLRDVVVKVAGARAAQPAAAAAPVVIEQTGCTYRPRVVGVLAGQKLAIKNADGTLHNVHAYRGDDTEFNLAQPANGKPIERAVDGAGDVLTLKCDVHPWMRAFAVVMASPLFAVTGADGAFAIADVPPGKHVVEAWHPTLGVKKAEVTVAAGKTAELTIHYP